MNCSCSESCPKFLLLVQATCDQKENQWMRWVNREIDSLPRVTEVNSTNNAECLNLVDIMEAS
uniref:Uncharacterized protein n=1 Tax=Rhizophora mucronata TaxID=61149 RepID=A0A2P2QI82_RHIMU